MVALKIVILLKELCTPVYTSIQTADSTANGARKPLTSNTADRKSASRAAQPLERQQVTPVELRVVSPLHQR